MALVAVAALGFGAFTVLSGSDRDVEDADITTTTAESLEQRMSMIEDYCELMAGTAWPQVPAHVASEGGRTFVSIMSTDDPEFDRITDAGPSKSFDRAKGGSTLLSPNTDGRYELDPGARMRTRTATCVQPANVSARGVTCNYYQTGNSAFPGVGFQPGAGLQLTQVRLRYDVVVYELHSGGILHKGEIVIDDPSCPDYAILSNDKPYVASPLSDRMILDWLGSHFVDGVPA